MIVLDTNVLSEVMRPAPAVEVLEWLTNQPASGLFTTAITQAEILYGLALLPKGKRRAMLSSAAMAMFDEDFGGRILPFDADAALLNPEIATARRKSGRPISQLDCQIASIVSSRGATLVTRNTKDFELCGIPLFSPWKHR